jgi:dipeptidase
MGWWNPEDGDPDWAQVFGIGEYSHPYYSQSRVWRIFDRLAPSSGLSPYVQGPFSTAYPFSIEPDTPVNITTALSIFRDHYEGTVYDLTAAPAGGPFGDPYRVWGQYDLHDAPYEGQLKPGSWPRPISTDPCGYSYVCQGRTNLPGPIGGVCWLGLSSPAETCYVPFYAGVYHLPIPYLHGSHWEFDLNTAFWPYELLQNYARLMYSTMTPDIQAEQKRIEGAAIANQTEIEAKALELYQTSEPSAREFLTAYTNETAMNALSDWKALMGRMIVTYRNGNFNDVQNRSITNIGYPDWWYEYARYQYGPRIYDVQGLHETPGVRYVGEEVNTTGDPLSYIRSHQT